MFFDPLYWMLLLPAMALSAWAAFATKSRFSRYGKVPNRRHTSGAETARYILDQAGLRQVRIEEASGMLSDHYDPTSQTVRLSSDVYHGRSISSLAVAAHEVGHALQHKEGYAPLALRNVVVPVASFSSNISWLLIMVGFALSALSLAKVGVVLFGVTVIFQLLTLPVEFDASARAKKILFNDGIVTPSEREGVSSVLSAAAMTYVAGAMTSILTLVYYLMRLGIIGGAQDDRR